MMGEWKLASRFGLVQYIAKRSMGLNWLAEKQKKIRMELLLMLSRLQHDYGTDGR